MQKLKKRDQKRFPQSPGGEGVGDGGGSSSEVEQNALFSFSSLSFFFCIAAFSRFSLAPTSLSGGAHAEALSCSMSLTNRNTKQNTLCLPTGSVCCYCIALDVGVVVDRRHVCHCSRFFFDPPLAAQQQQQPALLLRRRRRRRAPSRRPLAASSASYFRRRVEAPPSSSHHGGRGPDRRLFFPLGQRK